ncbi:MAG TPA: hypothetical protein VM308_00485 [Sphingomicrobium sp.]|nr:hypothetical protein [Sphingomicrobium sp.]
MTHETTIAILLGRGAKGLGELDAAEWRRVAARTAWATEMIDKWYQAMLHMDEVCGEAVTRLSEDEFNRLFDEEEAKVAALRAQIDAVIERDEWPPHLHWTI